MIQSMGSILQIGHKAIADIFTSMVEVTEKIDGSFISFGIIDDELQMRSKGQELHEGAPSSKMFDAGIQSIKERAHLLVPGWVYRGEYLAKPKHNSLAYDRIPRGHIALFDVEYGPGDHAGAHGRLSVEAATINLENAPVLHWDTIDNADQLKTFLETDSFLGGQKIEGVVVKNYNQFLHGHIMMGKLVSEAFKEVHSKEWKVGNPNKGDIVEQIIGCYATEARWKKAIHHLMEKGELTGGPQDIGPLMREIAEDVLKEERDSISEKLFEWAWKQISRGVNRGFPEFYKQLLLEEAFEC